MLTRLSEHLRRSGWKGIAHAVLAKVLRKPLAVAAAVPGAPHPVLLRLRSSDLWTFDEIFQRREYDVPLPEDALTIIDAGANIGLASVYFALRFPGARVIALEPEEKNFELLCANTEPYPNVEPVRAALWYRSTTLDLSDPGGGAWAFRVSPADGAGSGANRVPAVTIPQLLAERGLERLDVLKVDIEGSEREVFAHSDAWIGQVRAVVVELHEGIAPGCQDAFELATRDFEYRWEKGENLVVAREAHPWPVAS